MTTPSGAPAWTRTAGIEDYGGHMQKVNFASQGVINARTDVGAEAINAIARDLVAATRTAPFAVLKVQCQDTAATAPDIGPALLMSGTRSAPYSGATPPAGFPAAVRNGDGDVTLTFDADYLDDYSVSGALIITGADGGLMGAIAGIVTCEVSGSTVRCRVTDTSGGAMTDTAFTLQVW